MWNTGQEGGTATARLLLGLADPSGHNSVTWPVNLNDTIYSGNETSPLYPPTATPQVTSTAWNSSAPLAVTNATFSGSNNGQATVSFATQTTAPTPGSDVTISGVGTQSTGSISASGTISSLGGASGTAGSATLNLSATPTFAPQPGYPVTLTGGSGVTGGPWTVLSASGSQIVLSGPVTFTTAPTGATWSGMGGGSGTAGSATLTLTATPSPAPTVGDFVTFTGGAGITGGPWTVASTSGSQVVLNGGAVTFTTPPTGITFGVGTPGASGYNGTFMVESSSTTSVTYLLTWQPGQNFPTSAATTPGTFSAGNSSTPTATTNELETLTWSAPQQAPYYQSNVSTSGFSTTGASLNVISAPVVSTNASGCAPLPAACPITGGGTATSVTFGLGNPGTVNTPGTVALNGDILGAHPERLGSGLTNSLNGSSGATTVWTQDMDSGYKFWDAEGDPSNTPNINTFPAEYPFGWGLSYTTFGFSNLSVSNGNDGGADVTFTVTNTGSVAGTDVAQVYVGPPADASSVASNGIAFAPRSLVQFTRVPLNSGASQTVTLHVDPRQLSYWSPGAQKWVLDSAGRQLFVGDADNLGNPNTNAGNSATSVNSLPLSTILANSTPATATCSNEEWNGSSVNNLTVPSGSWCDLVDMTINGNLTLQSGATGLRLVNSTVTGDLNSMGSAAASDPRSSGVNVVSNTAINGNVLIQNSASSSPWDLGMYGNTIGGSVAFQGNASSANVVSNNAITGSLYCATNGGVAGGSNTASALQGQCGSLTPAPSWTDSLIYTGPTTFTNGASATLSATLTDALTGAPVAGRTITFTLAPSYPQTCSGVTNSNGVASCTISAVNVPTGTRGVNVSFAGDGGGNFYYYPSNFVSTNATVNQQPPTTLTYTGDTIMTNGTSATLSATLTDPNNANAPIVGDTLTFTLAPSYNAQTCSGVTNGSGLATCTINSVNEPVGTRNVQVVFAGDANNYAPNTVNASVTVNPQPADNLIFNGPSSIANGSSVTVSANLQDANTNAGIDGDTLTFVLAPAQNAQTCTGVTAG